MDDVLLTKLRDLKDTKDVVEKMLKPPLYVLSELYPRLFPIDWIHSPSPVSDDVSLNVLFKKCCNLVHSLNDDDDDVAEKVLLYVTNMDIVCCWLMMRQSCFSLLGAATCDRLRLYRVSFMVDQIRGVDVACAHLETKLKNPEIASPKDFCQLAREMGFVERARFLALEFRTRFDSVAPCPKYVFLTRLLGEMYEAEAEERECKLAVGMALHARLGRRSSLACLGPDLLILCVPEYEAPRLNSWTDTMGWSLLGIRIIRPLVDGSHE